MKLAEIDDIPIGLVDIAEHYISAPELRDSFRYARRHMPVFRRELGELDQIVSAINTTDVARLPQDMVNTRRLKGYLKATNKQLPLMLNEATQRDRFLQSRYARMLQEGDKLLGPFFHFHTNIHADGRRLSAAVMDGYGLFVPFILGRTGDLLKETQGLAVNALCEVLAESQAKNIRPSRLFTNTKRNGWYKPDYGLRSDFLARHNLLSESGAST